MGSLKTKRALLYPEYNAANRSAAQRVRNLKRGGWCMGKPSDADESAYWDNIAVAHATAYRIGYYAGLKAATKEKTNDKS